jgi:hypothetical protein
MTTSPLPDDFYARSNYIARASTAHLEHLLTVLQEQDQQDQFDEITDELVARAHDLDDPSSGCHLPS